MKIEDLKLAYTDHPRVHDLQKAITEKKYPIQIHGQTGSSLAFIANAVWDNDSHTHVFILNEKEQAIYFYNDLSSIAGENHVLFFPASEKKPYEEEEIKNANILMRAEALNNLTTAFTKLLIVTYPEAIAERVVNKKHLAKNTLEIIAGSNYSIALIDEVLLDYEFEKVDFVYEPGQFSVRGGIIDIFSFSHEDPYRLEFFGDQVESIRSFDTITQLSKTKMGRIQIIPNVQDKIFYESRESFLNFISVESKLWIENKEICARIIQEKFNDVEKIYENLQSTISRLKPEELFINENLFIEETKKFPELYFGLKVSDQSQSNYNNTLSDIKFLTSATSPINKNFDLLAKILADNTKNKYENLILAEQSKQIERLHSIFEDQKKEVHFHGIKAGISEGFVDHDLKISCFTDHQIFERYHRYKLKEGFNKTKEALTLKDLLNLQKGDYVTHIDHGVGQFSGLEKIDVNGKQQEAIRLIYKGGDVLYVSIHSLHRISKYTGKDGTEPTMHKLGSNTWQNLKQKAKKRVKEIAFDLIKLYAKRKATQGFRFSPDNYLQTELEASFIYEDTPDQLKATVAVKKDMESDFPMDRLICGDVGFGKTEIAMRAAFKAVCDSKQVAILCPTTILSIQHYKSFKERLKDFPCKVDYINRFKGVKSKKETLTKLANGEIDILIGTHAIVGKDIKFKDLGLLIIDEEQKFGVGIKDKLKLMRSNIDSLTLTATPIPRTLQFSLMGARDLSIISTPPPNRHPVQTEISTFNTELIRDRISFELQRGGQVYFVHNKISSIKEMAGMIQKICPAAKVVIGHGQMSGDELESVMIDFIEGNYDVLLATTIIESGIDIPNANTIIINDAHNFGLSDLHQLRGRVGRSNKRAFCVLLTQPMFTLSQEARKRLLAIEQFSELGSGFSIAMRDLDIRGAGNLLGGEQSGFISDIGYETYQKILDEAIQELKETDFKDLYEEERQENNESYVRECNIESDLELLLPDYYVNNVNERLILYRELDELKNEEALLAYRKKLEDRFGPPPTATLELLDTIRLRWYCCEAGIERLILKNNKLSAYFISNELSAFYQSSTFSAVLKYVQENHMRVKMEEKNNKLQLRVPAIHSIAEAIEEIKLLSGK